MKKPLVFVKLLNEGDTGSEEDRYNQHHNMNVGAMTRGVFKAYAFFLLDICYAYFWDVLILGAVLIYG